MKNVTLPLMLPTELLGQIRRTAREGGLSLADAVQRSIRLGLPGLRHELASRGVNPLKPFTRAEARQAFAPDPEWDALAAVMAQLPVSRHEEE